MSECGDVVPHVAVGYYKARGGLVHLMGLRGSRRLPRIECYPLLEIKYRIIILASFLIGSPAPQHFRHPV